MIQINASAAQAPKAIIGKIEKKRKEKAKKGGLMDEMLLYLQATVNTSGQATVGNRSPRACHWD